MFGYLLKKKTAKKIPSLSFYKALFIYNTSWKENRFSYRKLMFIARKTNYNIAMCGVCGYVCNVCMYEKLYSTITWHNLKIIVCLLFAKNNVGSYYVIMAHTEYIKAASCGV